MVTWAGPTRAGISRAEQFNIVNSLLFQTFFCYFHFSLCHFLVSSYFHFLFSLFSLSLHCSLICFPWCRNSFSWITFSPSSHCHSCLSTGSDEFCRISWTVQLFTGWSQCLVGWDPKTGTITDFWRNCCLLRCHPRSLLIWNKRWSMTLLYSHRHRHVRSFLSSSSRVWNSKTLTREGVCVDCVPWCYAAPASHRHLQSAGSVWSGCEEHKGMWWLGSFCKGSRQKWNIAKIAKLSWSGVVSRSVTV